MIGTTTSSRDLGGFYRTWLVYLGVDLGFFRALRAAGDAGLTVGELASRTSTNPRAVETWVWAADAHGLLRPDGDVVHLDPDTAAVLLDEQRPEFLGGQFVHTVVATLDWDRMGDFFRTGVPVRSRPDRYRAAIEQVTRQDIAVFFTEGLAALPNLVSRLVAGGARPGRPLRQRTLAGRHGAAVPGAEARRHRGRARFDRDGPEGSSRMRAWRAGSGSSRSSART